MLLRMPSWAQLFFNWRASRQLSGSSARVVLHGGCVCVGFVLVLVGSGAFGDGFRGLIGGLVVVWVVSVGCVEFPVCVGQASGLVPVALSPYPSASASAHWVSSEGKASAP